VVEFVTVQHPRFKRAQRDIFTRQVTPDCMTHQCSLLKHDNRVKLDACCQYGVDADVSERDGILAHADQIRSLLRDEVAGKPWFKDEIKHDPDFPTGRYVRTNTHDDGCIFLAHDRRGCAIHRASIEGDWDFHGIKPHVCRLFPISYETDAIVLSDDYADYSCAYDASAPSVYRVGRADLGAIFGADLVTALDATEVHVTASPALVSPRALVSRTP
jgi:Fe-S-cluster containining protein